MDTSGKTDGAHPCIKCGTLYTAPTGTDTGVCKDCGGASTSFKDDKPDPEGSLRCLVCAKLYEPSLGIGKIDQVCPDCRNTMNGTAKLLCARCGLTICRLAPKVLDNEFIIRPNAVLHSDWCNICQPGLSESTIVEIDLWNKTRRPKKTLVTARGGKKV